MTHATRNTWVGKYNDTRNIDADNTLPVNIMVMVVSWVMSLPMSTTIDELATSLHTNVVGPAMDARTRLMVYRLALDIYHNRNMGDANDAA